MWPRFRSPWRLGKPDSGTTMVGTDGDRACKGIQTGPESLSVLFVVAILFHGPKALLSFAFGQSRTSWVSLRISVASVHPLHLDSLHSGPTLA